MKKWILSVFLMVCLAFAGMNMRSSVVMAEQQVHRIELENTSWSIANTGSGRTGFYAKNGGTGSVVDSTVQGTVFYLGQMDLRRCEKIVVNGAMKGNVTVKIVADYKGVDQNLESWEEITSDPGTYNGKRYVGSAWNALGSGSDLASMTLSGNDWSFHDFSTTEIRKGSLTAISDIYMVIGTKSDNWGGNYDYVDFYINPDAALPETEAPVYWGDNGDGTYQSIILPGDYSDADVTRVGDDYYMVVSSFMDTQGAPILHSRDLVNWETISYAVPDTTQLWDAFSWENMQGYSSSYGHGVYACSIRYHEGKYYVYIPIYPSGGIFVSTADSPKGPWTLEKITDKNGKHVQYNNCQITDICPFWDDDGSAYLIVSHLSGQSDYNINGVAESAMGHPAYIYKMNESGNQLVNCDSTNGETMRDTGVLVRNIKNTEGNKIYKIGDYYYIFNIDFVGRSSNGKGAYIRRSKFLFGAVSEENLDTPYTEYEETHHAGYYETRFLGNDSCIPTQGGFVDTKNDQWFFIGQKNDGNAGGRKARLVPVEWKDYWPVMGIDKNGDGTADEDFVTGEKPILGEKVTTFQGSDNFENGMLSVNWQWNHQPRDEYWSVTEREGYLRLKSFQTTNKTHDFWKAGNTIHQRFIDTNAVQATIKVDISGMEDGQEAGLAHFNGGTAYATYGIVQKGTEKYFLYTEDGVSIEGNKLADGITDIWFKTLVSGYQAGFYYSYDGVHYKKFSKEYTIKWGSYRGDRIGIYTFNNTSDNGYIDVDFFDYSYTGSGALGDVYVTDTSLYITNTKAKKTVTLYEADGTGKKNNVTDKTVWSSDDENIVKVDTEGIVTGIANGNTTVMAQYKDMVYLIDVTVAGFPEQEQTLKGDVDQDGTVTAKDVLLILNHASGELPLAEDVQQQADLNEDSQITAVDALLALGKSVQTPQE